VLTDDQAETDRYWNAIVDNGGEESACGWCRDSRGFTCQITPRALLEAMNSHDEAAAKRAMDTMMTMTKIDIVAIGTAPEGQRSALRAEAPHRLPEHPRPDRRCRHLGPEGTLKYPEEFRPDGSSGLRHGQTIWRSRGHNRSLPSQRTVPSMPGVSARLSSFESSPSVPLLSLPGRLRMRSLQTGEVSDLWRLS
jgi:3-demethylubiquinone-9 3-methyltransferase